jgi:hypothetical protein
VQPRRVGRAAAPRAERAQFPRREDGALDGAPDQVIDVGAATRGRRVAQRHPPQRAGRFRAAPRQVALPPSRAGTAATIGLFFAAAAVSVALTGAVQAFFAPRGGVSSGGRRAAAEASPCRCRAPERGRTAVSPPARAGGRRLAPGSRRFRVNHGGCPVIAAPDSG